MAAVRTGLPAVTNPREGDWRSVATAVSNIRQRLETLESSLTATAAESKQKAFTQNSTFSIQINNLQAQLNALESTLADLQNTTGATGDTFTAQAFEAMAPNTPVVWASPGFVRAADPTDDDRAFGLAGLLISPAAGAGQQVTVRRVGVENITGAAFTPYQPVYANAGTGPALTQDPSTGGYAMQVGVAVSATHLAVLPQASWIYALDETAAGDDESAVSKRYADHRAANPVLTKIASAALSGHRIVIADSANGVNYADNETLAHAQLVLGMTLGAAAEDTEVRVQLEGFVDEPSWTWTPEEPIFLGADGALTQTPPVSPAVFSLVVGFAVSATRIVLNFKEPVALA